MTEIQLLRLASKITNQMGDKMAHALGWPTPYHIMARGKFGRRVKWANPYRNYYLGEQCPHWEAAEKLGLATRQPAPKDYSGSIYWSVTGIGKRALRLRLQAVRFNYSKEKR